MSKLYFFYSSIVYIFLLLTPDITQTYQKAVICVAVADLVGQPLQSLYPQQTIEESYATLPVCHKTNPQYACPRLHQLLFNDIVEVIETKNNESLIQVKNIFYITPHTDKPQTRYWTANKNIRLLDSISVNALHIPEPIDFNNPAITQSHVITLTQPYYNTHLKCTFSAGTRFVCKHKRYNPKKKILVFVFDHANNKEISMWIPAKAYSIPAATQHEQIAAFVDLLRTWAHQHNSFIPYVWGGTSFTTTMNKPFFSVKTEKNSQKCSFYEFNDDQTQQKNGFDCSGIIARAAQTCGMPYFYKNTTTIDRYLKPLTPEETLGNGDLILIKGHVMVVSDTQQNLLIEARSYGHGYGKVHEIELKKVFDSMTTYDDLCNAFFNKQQLSRKNKDGQVEDIFTDWKILKISSIYSKNDSDGESKTIHN